MKDTETSSIVSMGTRDEELAHCDGSNYTTSANNNANTKHDDVATQNNTNTESRQNNSTLDTEPALPPPSKKQTNKKVNAVAKGNILTATITPEEGEILAAAVRGGTELVPNNNMLNNLHRQKKRKRKRSTTATLWTEAIEPMQNINQPTNVSTRDNNKTSKVLFFCDYCNGWNRGRMCHCLLKTPSVDARHKMDDDYAFHGDKKYLNIPSVQKRNGNNITLATVGNDTELMKKLMPFNDSMYQKHSTQAFVAEAEDGNIIPKVRFTLTPKKDTSTKTPNESSKLVLPTCVRQVSNENFIRRGKDLTNMNPREYFNFTVVFEEKMKFKQPDASSSAIAVMMNAIIDNIVHYSTDEQFDLVKNKLEIELGNQSHMLARFVTNLWKLMPLCMLKANVEVYTDNDALGYLLGKLLHILSSSSHSEPISILFDDVQWANAPSLGLIGTLVSSAHKNKSRVLFAFGYQGNDRECNAFNTWLNEMKTK